MYVTSLAAPDSLQRLVGQIPSALQLPPLIQRVSETLLQLGCTARHSTCYMAAANPVLADKTPAAPCHQHCFLPPGTQPPDLAVQTRYRPCLTALHSHLAV